jgi:hypothetical protein
MNPLCTELALTNAALRVMGLETQPQWSDLAIAHTTPVLLALFSLVTLLALRPSQDGPMPVRTMAWYQKTEPTLVDCLALVRRHFWRARYMVDSTTEPEWALAHFW